jgi:hypothetical protein
MVKVPESYYPEVKDTGLNLLIALRRVLSEISLTSLVEFDGFRAGKSFMF